MIKKHYKFFKSLHKEMVLKAHKEYANLRTLRDNGQGAYNY